MIMQPFFSWQILRTEATGVISRGADCQLLVSLALTTDNLPSLPSTLRLFVLSLASVDARHLEGGGEKVQMRSARPRRRGIEHEERRVRLPNASRWRAEQVNKA